MISSAHKLLLLLFLTSLACGFAFAEEGPEEVVYLSCIEDEDSKWLPGRESRYAIQGKQIFVIRDDGTLIDQCSDKENVTTFCRLTDREAKWTTTFYKDGSPFVQFTTTINRYTLSYRSVSTDRDDTTGTCTIIDNPAIERKF